MKKIYQLPYDDVYDKDIDDWLESLPRERKGEFVRTAIRLYINDGLLVKPVTPAPVVEKTEPQTERKKPSKPLSRK